MEACGEGEEPNKIKTACVKCDYGFYKNLETEWRQPCTKCAADFPFTLNKGSESWTNCTHCADHIIDEGAGVCYSIQWAHVPIFDKVWEDAQAQCLNMSGHLIWLDSMDLWNKFDPIISALGYNLYIWVGAHANASGSFIWGNGIPVTLPMNWWDPGATGDCLAADWVEPYPLLAADCSDFLSFYL